MTASTSPDPAVDAIFNPRSVALIGASNTEGKMGYVYMRNLLGGGWGGRIYPVNPKEPKVHGLDAYPSLKDIPHPVDLAAIVVPNRAVPSVIKECVEKRVKVAVVISAGFKETGEEGAKLEDEIVATARKGGLRVVGPNCFGVYNCNTGLNISMGLGTPPRGGDIAFVTQSGAYGMGIFAFALDRGLRFSKVLAFGNKADVDETDALRYLAQDPESRVVALFLESLERGRDFFTTARELTARKPVVVAKTGRTEAGARAALSHTGALVGSSTIFEAALRQAGVIHAQTGLDLVDIVKGLDWQPLPKGMRVGIVTNSGGTGVELTDLCQDKGLEVPQLPPEAQNRLKPYLLPFASAKNPIDLTPDWSRFSDLYPRALRELFQCPTVDIIIPVLLQRSAMIVDVVEGVREAVVELQRGRGVEKPVLVCWVSTREAEKNQKILEDAHIPCYEWPERTVKVASALAAYAAYLEKRKKATHS